MGLIQRFLAAMTGEVKYTVEGGPATEAEEAAWLDYQQSWEMDPPPSPRAVFLAGLRRRTELAAQNGTSIGSAPSASSTRSTAPGA